MEAGVKKVVTYYFQLNDEEAERLSALIRTGSERLPDGATELQSFADEMLIALRPQ